MKNLMFFSCMLFTNIAAAQLLVVANGTDLTILSGTIFRSEDFTLTPSANYVISNNTLTRSSTIIHSSANPYITKVYQFANSTNLYSGSIQINYSDGAELSGIPEGTLTLNIHNGTSWTAYATATRDGTSNFVLTNGLVSVSLNELTLANLSFPLPLIWASFTATKQNRKALLEWSTAQEQNTRNFEVEHSSNGINWTGISILPAAGNSNSTKNYSYLHTTPVTGNNYYRILQTDNDNRKSYSDLRVLLFTAAGEAFTITGNPVTNKVLIVQVNVAAELALYTADGKMMWKEQVNTGTKYIDVSRYAKGVYLLKTNSTTQRVVIQ